MAYQLNIREKAVENKLRKDYFSAYDAEEVLGDIDFAVAVPTESPQLFEPEYLLWAEAKKSNHNDIYESFVQLILTIGKARTFDKHLPPAFLGAFDAEKIAFIQYNAVLDIFYQNDFNWNVTPSNHETKEFRQIYDTVKGTLDRELLLFYFDNDDKELRGFIKKNFIVGKSKVSKVRINKNNFTAIYQKWLKEVKPTIAKVNWETAKKEGIIDADFYLADILSEHNVTLREKLYVLLRKDYYELDRKKDNIGFFNSKKAEFTDGQKAHTQFWNRYERPPKREYWDYIVDRRDLLVPQDVRERKGSFYTPSQWVELSQQYIAAELGENWQDEYYVWDCCAGTGNLLAGLTNKHHIWASTLDQADVDVMHDRINRMNEASANGTSGANLLHDHVFQFDFLNDPLDKLPKSLRDVVEDEEKRKKLVIYINPPYAEASNARTVTGSGQNRTGLSKSSIQERYKTLLGRAGNELFAQFYARIVSELSTSVLALFSKLKIVQAPNFQEFRRTFRAKPGRFFLVPANTFDNVKGQFPIGFQIWYTGTEEYFRQTTADIYDAKGDFLGNKKLYSHDGSHFIIEWLRQYYDKENEHLAYHRFSGTDFQHSKDVYITLNPYKADIEQVKGNWITKNNIIPMSVFFAVRHCIEATWINDRDQFLFPNDGWKEDKEFQGDCLTFTLFHGQNRISCKHGKNHFIPFTEQEVDARDNFSSHFMSDLLQGKKVKEKAYIQGDLFADTASEQAPLLLSPEAQAVMDAGRELWRYYHSQEDAVPDASYYDIRLHFQGTKTTSSGKEQMRNESDDPKYNELIADLRQRQKALASKIATKVYEYGFLKK